MLFCFVHVIAQHLFQPFPIVSEPMFPISVRWKEDIRISFKSHGTQELRFNMAVSYHFVRSEHGFVRMFDVFVASSD